MVGLTPSRQTSLSLSGGRLCEVSDGEKHLRSLRWLPLEAHFDNLRVIGIVPCHNPKWPDLYRKRQGIEWFFSSVKRSGLLDRHQYPSLD